MIAGFGVVVVGDNAEWQTRFDGEFFSVAVRRGVSGVRDGQIAICGDEGASAGDEACYLAVENAVEVSEDFSGFSHRAAAQRADDGTHGHCSFEALAADVSDDNQQRAIVGRHDLEKVTAYFTGGKIDAFDGKTGGDGRLCWDKQRLNVARRLEFTGKARFLLPGEREAPNQKEKKGKDEDGADGGTRHQHERFGEQWQNPV